MSACNQISDQTLTLLAYGEPAPTEAEDHLALCPECRARVEEIRRVRATATRLLPAGPSAPVLRELRRQAETIARGRQRRRTWFRILVPTATASALLLLVLGIWTRPTTGPAPIAAATTWAEPLDLANLESDLDQGLNAIGIEDNGPDLIIGNDGADENQDSGPTPADNGATAALVWGMEEKSIDQLEVALVSLERDLGIKSAGDYPAEGE